MIEFLAGLFALGFGVGLACWICGTMLDESNNIGDSRGNSATYKAETTFTSKCNRMDRSSSREYLRQNVTKKEDPNGPDDQAQVRRLTEEERKQKAKDDKKANVPKGAFVSKNTDGYTSSKDDEPEWVKRADRGQW